MEQDQNKGTESPPAEPLARFGEDYIRALPIFYWALGITNALIALYGFFFVGMGIFFSAVPWEEPTYQVGPDASPGLVPGLFIGTGVAFLVGFGAIAAFQMLTGRWIKNRLHRGVCLTVAAISCIFIPFGTVLGVLTFIALREPRIAAEFESGSRRH